MNNQSQDGVILVTGGAGYIGSRVVRDLVADDRFSDYTIRIYDSLRRHHVYGLLDLPEEGDFEFVEGDILDRSNLKRAMQDVQAVLHLAAIVRTPLSFDHPDWTKQVNHWGTASVVECSLEMGVGHLVYASSASVYGPGGPFREEDDCQPVGPYAEAKLQGEHEVKEAADRGLSVRVARLGTVFGNAPAMRFDAVVNRFVYLVSSGRPLVVHGEGNQVRPLIHVEDASAVLRLCLSDGRPTPRVLNAASTNPSVNEIANAVEDLMPSAERKYTDQDVLTEVSFEVDSNRLRETGFRFQHGLEYGLLEMLSRWKGLHGSSPTKALSQL
ncbi:NAD-dependent epimerase/dehydratase family protein [Salinibacter ruber]|uniref:NAD-dependent epimerase/dehydratase family protein n=1 Tax=Salinibacter ruber TaxID=146919 RepID=UPI002073F175|nr:NAD(P)-dependent oxidoreductase [Salinibacter ruber]MCS4114585.1 UDP-glucose 4-epimerase [Salinibacter ruber]MCS4181782.1 UDP-glucose 4-epimerase [Salinibacter ruber]